MTFFFNQKKKNWIVSQFTKDILKKEDSVKMFESMNITIDSWQVSGEINAD
jgi:hypothetical protein